MGDNERSIGLGALDEEVPDIPDDDEGALGESPPPPPPPPPTWFTWRRCETNVLSLIDGDEPQPPAPDAEDGPDVDGPDGKDHSSDEDDDGDGDDYGHGGGGIAIRPSRGATTAGQGCAVVAGGSVRGSTTASQPVLTLRRGRSAGLPDHGATMVGMAIAAAPTTSSSGRGATTASAQPARPGHGTTMAGQGSTVTGSGSVRGSTTAGQSGAGKSTSLGKRSRSGAGGGRTQAKRAKTAPSGNPGDDPEDPPDNGPPNPPAPVMKDRDCDRCRCYGVADCNRSPTGCQNCLRYNGRPRAVAVRNPREYCSYTGLKWVSPGPTPTPNWLIGRLRGVMTSACDACRTGNRNCGQLIPCRHCCQSLTNSGQYSDADAWLDRLFKCASLGDMREFRQNSRQQPCEGCTNATSSVPRTASRALSAPPGSHPMRCKSPSMPRGQHSSAWV